MFIAVIPLKQGN